MSVDRDTLRQFYFSGASNFSLFSKRGSSPKRCERSSGGQSTATVAAAAVSEPAASQAENAPSPTLVSSVEDVSARGVTGRTKANPDSSVSKAVSNLRLIAPGASSQIDAIRSIAQQSPDSSILAPSKVRQRGPPPADAASKEYFAFLCQQQDVIRNHTRIDAALSAIVTARREGQEEITRLRKKCEEIVHELEENTNMNLKSKYDDLQLIKDAGLSLQLGELAPRSQCETAPIRAIGDALEAVKAANIDTTPFIPYKSSIDQALRRISILEQELQSGYNFNNLHLHAAPADPLLVQIKDQCELPKVESIITEHESAIANITFEIERERARRDAALEDGEVNVVEELCFGIIDRYEKLSQMIIDKAHALQDSGERVQALTKVAVQRKAPISGQYAAIKSKNAVLRARCEQDVEKILALREKVQEVEQATRAKVVRDIEFSDKLLADNTARIGDVWVRMAELERELELLERDRAREVAKRLVQRDKDEHRRTEYAKFMSTVEDHLEELEHTIKNTQMSDHGCGLLEEMLHKNFVVLDEDLAWRQKLLADVKLEAHKEHVEAFRALLRELGEIIYRKESMIEALDKKVQQAHVQQELLAETYNPNAQKFGQVKKQLLTARNELEEDVENLKKRAENALSAFRYTETALLDAHISFLHPVSEQEYHTLAMRTKMLEYKAMLEGHVKGTSRLLEEIEELQQSVDDTQHEIEKVNMNTTGAMCRTIAMIRAAYKARLGVAE